MSENPHRQKGTISPIWLYDYSPIRIDRFMIITVTSYKGGVGKTTTAIHLAAYLQRLAPTLLVDGDAIRSATKWSQRGGDTGLPFKVVTHAQMISHIRNYTHVIIDTEGNPTDDDFKDLATNCELLVIPAVPESVATDGLTHTLTKQPSTRGANPGTPKATHRGTAAARDVGRAGHPGIHCRNSPSGRFREGRGGRSAGLRCQRRPQRAARLEYL